MEARQGRVPLRPKNRFFWRRGGTREIGDAVERVPTVSNLFSFVTSSSFVVAEQRFFISKNYFFKRDYARLSAIERD